jgi:hypothetical protein
MSDESISRPYWSQLRFSLRTLIVVVLVIGVWLGRTVRNAGIQREAVAAIARAGGGVCYDWQWEDGRFKRRGRPWWPTWLTDRVGVDYFYNVVAVSGIHATNLDMIQVGRLGRLESLTLGGPNEVTDDGLAKIEKLIGLKTLDVSGFLISDVGLAHLRGLVDLENLTLMHAKISEAGLAHLKGLTRLKYLVLSCTHLTDAGLSHLKGLTSVEVLYLSDTKVSDAGLAYLKGLTRLIYLNLAGTRVTDAGLKELRGWLPRTTIDPRPVTSQ